MNKELIKRWNQTVDINDTVYHLGDFSMGGKMNVHLRERLNGKIILIRGNHDKSVDFMKEAGFDEVYNNLVVEMDGLKLYLSHIPLHVVDPYHGREVWEKFAPVLLATPPTYDYFICGHVHNKWARRGNTINAGVDVSNFRPITLQELLKRDA